MIWGNVKYIDHYKGISHALDVALDYLAAGDFKELENGKLDLDQYPGLISFYTFEMGLYMILPLAKQRQLLEE